MKMDKESQSSNFLKNLVNQKDLTILLKQKFPLTKYYLGKIKLIMD